MSKADKPAFPVVTESGLLGGSDVAATGLTKREYFAAHAPITLQDANDLLTHQGHGAAGYQRVMAEWVKMRADYADALLAALEGKPE